jgi:Na+/phosphate symporter
MKNSSDKIKEVGDYVVNLLLEKNKAYGDSALNPANIFAKGSAVDNLCCRIDDKLMRIKNKGIDDKTEDTLVDLIGYFILLKIAIENNSKSQSNESNRAEGDSVQERLRKEDSLLYDYWESSSTNQRRK